MDSLTTTFAALADPTRRAILARLAAGDAVVKDIASPFAMSSPAVSKHLRVLERAGLVEQGREKQWRPRRLCARPLAEAAQWLEDYRPFWDEKLDRLEAFVRKLETTRQAGAPAQPQAKRTPAAPITPTRRPRARKPARR